MPNNSESKCYFVQLQIDSYIDGELSEAQQDVFMSHVHGCEECGRELHYAQIVQDAVLDLPAIDCDEEVLEPIHRLANRGHENGSRANTSSSVFDQFLNWIGSTPLAIRYAIPVAAVAVLALALWPSLFDSQQATPIVAEQSVETQSTDYSPEDIQQALMDLNLAIDYLNEVSQRTEVMIGDRFLVTPLQDSLNASFDRARERNRNALQDALQNDPI